MLVPGAALWFARLPGLNAQQEHLLAVFVATIISLVAQPVRMGVSVVIAMTLLAVSGTLTPAKTLSGFSNVTVWLIFTAFLFSRAFTATGFGMRVGYLFVRRFGRTPLSLGYSIAMADLVLAPFIPSDTARGGGVVFPITRSVAVGVRLGARTDGAAHRVVSGAGLVSRDVHRLGDVPHGNGRESADRRIRPEARRRATDVAALALRFDRARARSPWRSFPGCCSSSYGRRSATRRRRASSRASELARMGPLRREEKWLIVIMIGVMAGWVGSPWHGINNTFVALSGLSAILLAKVLTWDDLLAEHRAWDALIWFAPLVMMADQLNELGVVKIFSAKLFGLMAGWPWPVALIALVAAYCYIHYSLREHDRARDGALSRVLRGGAGGRRAAAAGGAAARVLLESERRDDALRHRLRAGLFQRGIRAAGRLVARRFLISLVNLAIWLGLGMLWWKAIGLW